MSKVEIPNREIPVTFDAAQVAGSEDPGFMARLKTAILEWQSQTVLVLGFTGSGKTALLRSLFGASVPKEEEGLPTLDVNKYIFRVGKAQFVCADTPGHPTVEERLQVEVDNLVRGEYQGVINVVSYGYNQSKHRGVEHNAYKPLLSGKKINPRFLKKERAEELKYLEGWAGLVSEESSLKWVITVGNKADLWKRVASEVKQYYVGQGDYANRLRECLSISDYHHDFVELSAALDGFHGKRIHTRNLPSSAKIKAMKARLLTTLHERLS